MKPNGCKVLLVDDDGANRELLAALLTEQGYTTLSAGHGGEAVSQLEAGLDPDLILTDLMMPVMSGWELCEMLKKHPRWRSIPVVVMCGLNEQHRGQLRVEGAFDKPVDASLLLPKIATLCGV